MAKINEKRKASLQKRSVAELKRIAESGSLSAAAAQYELNRRASKTGSSLMTE